MRMISRNQTSPRLLLSAGSALFATALIAASPLGCQVISGLNDLDAREAQSSSVSSVSSSSSGGGSCDPGEEQACYSGPNGTEDIGPCHAGTQACEPSGSWGPCLGEVTPQAFENCASKQDINCDGALPEGCAGTPLLGALFGGMGTDVGNAVAVDSKGNAILVGEYTGTAMFGDKGINGTQDAETDVFVAKVNPSGAVLWARGFGGGGKDSGMTVAVGKDDTIVVGGTFKSTVMFGEELLMTHGQGDIFLAKLDPDGDPLWSRSYGGTGDDLGVGVTVDDSGNVVLTGIYSDAADFDDVKLGTSGSMSPEGFVLKVDPQGTKQWVIDFRGDGVEGGFGVTTDSAGDVVVSGRVGGTFIIGEQKLEGNGGNGAFVAKLSAADGAPLWTRVFGPASATPEQLVYDVARGGDNGEVVIAGHYRGDIQFPPNALLTAKSDLDLFVAKLDKNGDAQWSKSFGGAMNDAVFELGVDAFGAILIAGFFDVGLDFEGKLLTSVGSLDGLMAKLTPDGEVLWAQAVGGPSIDAVYGLAVTPDGASYLVGRSDQGFFLGNSQLVAHGGPDVLFAKLAP